MLKERSKDDGSEHFFIPLSTGVPLKEVDAVAIRRKQQLVLSPPENNNHNISKFFFSNSEGQLDSVQTLSINSYGLDGHTNQTGLIQPATVNSKRVYPDIDDALDQVFSPPLLMESSFFQDTYEDLLGILFSPTDCYLCIYIFVYSSNSTFVFLSLHHTLTSVDWSIYFRYISYEVQCL